MRIYIVALVICLVSCKEQPQQETAQKIEFDLYEPSEMANLMNEMYVYNLSVKDSILNGYLPSHFPMEFLEIHKAEMTKSKSRNTVFNSFSEVFLKAQETLHSTTDTTLVRQNFNDMVNVCITCHQTECTGPIPRIKKLLIQ